MKITEMFAFVASDEEGNEGIPAVMSDQTWLPLVGADVDRVDSLRSIAQEFANLENIEVRLVKFTNFEVVETLTPEDTEND